METWITTIKTTRRWEMSKSSGGSSRRRTRLRRDRNQNTSSSQRNPVEAGFGRARRAIANRSGNSL